jgi:hypothetical protein
MAQKIRLTEQQLNEMVAECVNDILNEEKNSFADSLKGLKNLFKRGNKTNQGQTDYAAIEKKYDPFAAPSSHPMTGTERNAVSAASQKSEVFQARQRVKELIQDRSYYLGAANKCLGNAKNLCKQYNIQLGEIMQELGMTNNTVKNYQHQSYNNDWANAQQYQDAMDESKKKKRR